MKKTEKEDLVESATYAGTPAATDLAHDYDEAQSALDKADCAELYRLWEKAVRDRGKVLEAMLQLTKHATGIGESPRWQPPSNTIDAMERVSLAAIQLARDVAVKKPSN